MAHRCIVADWFWLRRDQEPETILCQREREKDSVKRIDTRDTE